MCTHAYTKQLYKSLHRDRQIDKQLDGQTDVYLCMYSTLTTCQECCLIDASVLAPFRAVTAHSIACCSMPS